TPEHLPVDKMVRTHAVPAGPQVATDDSTPMVEPPPSGSAAPVDMRTGLDAYQRQLVVDALRSAHGNQTIAAKMLGISRGALITRIEAYGLARPRKGRQS